MSIDTVRVSVDTTDGVLVRDFDAEMVTIDQKDHSMKRKYITRGCDGNKTNLPRLTYYPGRDNSGKLVSEVSLPKFVCGNNASILDDSQVEKAMDEVYDWVCEKVNKRLDPLWRWRVSRLDCCYAWNVGSNIASYLAVFSGLPVWGFKRVPYIDGVQETEGFSWVAKSRKINMYDKGKESGIDFAAGVLRAEVQNLNGGAIRNLVDRLECESNPTDLVKGCVGRSELKRWFERVGFSGAMVSRDDLYSELLLKYGEGAASRWFFIDGYKKYGARMNGLVSERTYKRRLKEVRDNGWLCQSEMSLPELKIDD